MCRDRTPDVVTEDAGRGEMGQRTGAAKAGPCLRAPSHCPCSAARLRCERPVVRAGRSPARPLRCRARTAGPSRFNPTFSGPRPPCEHRLRPARREHPTLHSETPAPTIPVTASRAEGQRCAGCGRKPDTPDVIVAASECRDRAIPATWNVPKKRSGMRSKM